MKYLLLDSGNQKKIERFGDVSIVRPCGQALWKPEHKNWQADAVFSRDEGSGWDGKLAKSWIIEYDGLKFKLAPTEFGHLGIFPEHSFMWKWCVDLVHEGANVLNLFAYSGEATLALARAGASVCHLDASKGMVSWARENAALNGLESKPIRWIVDDAMKFLRREVKRGRRYDGILLDPPSFGRGAQGEVFKIERDLPELLHLCKTLLSEKPLFIALSNHTGGITPTVLQYLFEESLPGDLEVGELMLEGEGRPIPTGSYARWQPCK